MIEILPLFDLYNILFPGQDGEVATSTEYTIIKKPEIEGIYLRNNLIAMHDTQWTPHNWVWNGMSHQEFRDNAVGDVLLFGLGLGLDTFLIRDKIDVNTIDVIEKSADMIEIIQDQVAHSKVNIIQDMAMTFIENTTNTYDFIWFDIFPASATDFPGEKTTYENAAQQLLNPGGQIQFYQTWGTHQFY